jgi:hypothetical protein
MNENLVQKYYSVLLTAEYLRTPSMNVATPYESIRVVKCVQINWHE